MNNKETAAPRSPSFAHAITCFAGIFAMISRGLFLFQIALHTIMFLCLIRTALHASTLRVPVLDYAPYAFFNYLNPLVSIVIAAFWSRAVWQSDSVPDA